MGKVKISVVIAVYNAERYLEQCIDSVLEQPVQEIEVICVNDGSTDASLAILEKYQEKDRRIQIYTQDNQFAGVARNNGLKHAKGEYVLFLDADDFLKKDSLQILYQTAAKTEPDIVVFGHYRYDDKNTCVLDSDYVLDRLAWFGDGIKSAEEIAPYIFNFSEPCAWNKLYRREFIEERSIRFMKLRNTNDLFFSYMSLAQAERICVYKEQLIYYRVNNSTSLQGRNNKTSMDFSFAISELQNKLLDSHIFDKFKTSFYNMAMSTCYYNLCNHKGKDGFKEFYEYIRKYMSQDIRIEGYNPNKYTDKYVYYEMHKVINLSYDDYAEFERVEKQILHPYSYFPFWILPKNKNVVIYGAGSIGKSYYFQLSRMKYCKSLKMTDDVYEKMLNKDVCPIDSAFAGEIDYVVLAVPDVSVKEKIEKKLSFLGKGFKMLWQKPIQQEWSWMWEKE